MTSRKPCLRRAFHFSRLALIMAVTLIVRSAPAVGSQAAASDLDAKVRSFLTGHRDQWRDENVTETDGLFLYDFIRRHKYTKALEIGTSTGHSGIWIAWALSKTGGKLVTIEIDGARHARAVENFKEAGLDAYVDARLADAHEEVPLLKGSFDFVFVDADKEWYQNYFKMLLPKLEPGGCFAAHNVLNLEFMHGIKEFLDYARSRPEIETTVERTSGSGISLSYKKKLT
jgi:caffeoyl-CoA O-methyltransferase